MLSTDKIFIVLTAFVVVAAFTLGSQFSRNAVSLGSSDPGTPATVASSTLTALAANTAQLIMATTTCTSRTVTTTQSPVILTFNDKYVPTGQFGTWQAASTSVTYDSGLRGCGALKAYSYAAQNITVEDAR